LFFSDLIQLQHTFLFNGICSQSDNLSRTDGVINYLNTIWHDAYEIAILNNFFMLCGREGCIVFRQPILFFCTKELRLKYLLKMEV